MAQGSNEGTGGSITNGQWLLFPTLCCGSGFSIDVFNNTRLAAGAYSGAATLENTANAQWVGVTAFGNYWSDGNDGNALEF